jgi:hypothetical protein
MFKHRFLTVAASILCACAGTQSAMAELPSLTVKEWLGRFAVSANSKYEFTVETTGAIKLAPVGSRKQKAPLHIYINIYPNVVEMMPDGTQVTRQITSLESSDPATEELKKTTIRGKVTGDTNFEITIEDRQGTIYMGGKITQPGPAVKNPQRFTITTNFPNLYKSQSDNLDTDQQRDAFQKMLEKDKITLKRIDGKKVKQTFESNVDGTSEDITGPGITSAEVDCEGFLGRKIILTAATNSSLKLSNPNNEPLWNGYTLTWSADPEKDKGNKAQFAIEVR